MYCGNFARGLTPDLFSGMPTKKLVALYDQCPDCHGRGNAESRLPSRVKECDRCRGTGFVRRLPGVDKDRNDGKQQGP